VRKPIVFGLALLLAACHSRTREEPVRSAPAPARTGVETPRGALDAFLSAVKSQDLQAMSAAWGDKNGAVRDSKSLSRAEVEQREVILMRCFKHDSFRIVSEVSAPDNERQFQVELTRGTVKRVTDFFTVHGRDRWYVRSAAMDPVRDLCTAR